MFIMPKKYSNTTASQNFQLGNSVVLCVNRHFVVSRCYKKESIHLLGPAQHSESALKQNSTLGDNFLSWENMSHVPSIHHFKWSRLCYAAYSFYSHIFLPMRPMRTEGSYDHPAPYKTTTTRLPFSESLCLWEKTVTFINFHIPKVICLICTGKREKVSTG